MILQRREELEREQRGVLTYVWENEIWADGGGCHYQIRRLVNIEGSILGRLGDLIHTILFGN